MRQLRDWLLDLIGTLRQLYSNEISEEEVTEGLSNTLADEQQQDKTPESDHQTDPRDAPRNGPRWPKIIYTGLPGLPRKQYQMPNALSTDIAVPRSLDEALSSPQGHKCKASLHLEETSPLDARLPSSVIRMEIFIAASHGWLPRGARSDGVLIILKLFLQFPDTPQYGWLLL